MTRPLLALLLLLAGCVGGPSYTEGPREDEPHGLLVTGDDTSLWRVDGWDTYTRTGEQYLAPGHRKLRVKYQYPIESDAQIPYEWKDLAVEVKDGDVLLLVRTGEGEHGPYDVEVRRPRQRR